MEQQISDFNDTYKIKGFVKNHINIASIIGSALVVVGAALIRYLYYIYSSTYLECWGISSVYMPEIHFNQKYIIAISIIKGIFNGGIRTLINNGLLLW